MKLLVVLSCCMAVSVASVLTMNKDTLHEEWEQWKNKFQKFYYDEKDEAVRRYIWQKNKQYVEEHNIRAANGEHSYKLGMNKFGDLDSDEFAKIFLGLVKPENPIKLTCRNSSIYVTNKNYVDIPDSVDWRTKGYVNPVINQGECGSCWAFSATGALEGQHFKATGKLLDLSEQNLLDCSWPQGDLSCDGGLMDFAYAYIIQNGGIDTEASYPYTAKFSRRCDFRKENIGATMTSCIDVTPRKDENALKIALGTVGPVSLGIDASRPSFQFYRSGVYDEPRCRSTYMDLNHGVLGVGYGSEGGKDYWIIKNSWGQSWGEEGYVKMSRNKGNQCGIANYASYPVV